MLEGKDCLSQHGALVTLLTLLGRDDVTTTGDLNSDIFMLRSLLTKVSCTCS